MNLLLLLSALLSALAGSPVARAQAPAAQHVSSVAAAKQLLTAPATIPDRPRTDLVRVQCKIDPARCVTLDVAPIEPIFARRRRE